MDLSWLKKIKYSFQNRALVLMYHSINKPGLDPWELVVSPENFEQHLRVLENFRVVSPSVLAGELRRKNVLSNTVSLTFDDAYEDNFGIAKPLLEKYKFPAMYFVSTHFIGGRELFWWDELAGLIIESQQLPEQFSLQLNGHTFSYRLINDATLTDAKRKLQHSWIWHLPSPTERCALYLELWKLLRPLTHGEIRAVLEQIYRFSGNIPVKGNAAMDAGQLQQLTKHPLIETGVHCVTHPALSNHSPAAQLEEISTCKENLKKSGHQAAIIAYPYGDYNQDTVAESIRAGLWAGFTTAERVITSSSNIMEMGRFQVRNVDGETFEKQLKNWFSSSPVSP